MTNVVKTGWLLLVLAVIPRQVANACTVFAVSDGGVVLLGNNEDARDPYSRIWFLPAEEGRYGRVYLGFDRFGVTIPQGGMNECGLAFDILAGPSHRVKGDPRKERFHGNLVVQAMEKCASVKEVLAMFERYNHEGTWKGQYFFADKTGDAVIIEGDVVHRKKEHFQVATNFYLSQATSGVYPCWRYNTATKMLAKDEPVTVDLCRRVLAAVKLEGETPTVYSNVFDLKKGVLYLYHLQDFENVVSMELQAELRKGRRATDIASLFPHASAASKLGGSTKEPVSRPMIRVLDEQGVREAIKEYRILKASMHSRYDFSERVLNMFGIELVYAGRFADAIEVLKLAAEEHPQSANAYDSLAWAYMKSGQVGLAISNYEKSLELNPDNSNAVKRLEELCDLKP